MVALAGRFGMVTECFINMGRGQAIIEFAERQNALDLIHELTARPMIMTPSKRPIKALQVGRQP